ncbi:hypothetical protein AVEN_102900-1 [Araneus ventricosus]|uniref:Uncharacterized protein n=1 Tax=Araneus ventricosus TaxID=182803 RepID=A0A4Y2MA51_ARAVE|nr:hypothetical protein AVEN_102900-1 [Araneus ventricosus]
MDLVILNRCQMMRTTPKLAPPSPNFRTTSAGGRLTHDIRVSMHQAHMRGGSSLESGLEPGTLRLQSRDILFTCSEKLSHFVLT